MGSKSVPMPPLAIIRKSSKTAIRVEGLNNRQLSNASGLMLGSASKLPWADRLLVPMDTPKIERDNEGKRRKRKNEGINRRIETLITKAYEIGKFDGVDVALTIRKYGRYTTYNSKVHASWPPSTAEIQTAYPLPKNLIAEDVEKRLFKKAKKNLARKNKEGKHLMLSLPAPV